MAVELVGEQEGQSEGQFATPGLATPAKKRRKCCYGQEKKLSQYSSLSLSPLISHPQQKYQPFRE